MMTLAPLEFLLAQESAGPFSIKLKPLFEDHGIPLAIMGILVVFAALIFVSLFILLLPRMLAAVNGAGTGERERVAALTARIDGGLSEETLVVIAAAVAEAISEPHRIIYTRELTAEEIGWSLEGRLQHHASHNVRQRERR